MVKILFQVLLYSFFLNFMGCSAQKIYSVTIESEREDAYLEKKLIQLKFGTISYLENDVKSNTAVVLLHGFGGDKDNWNRFSAELDGNIHIIVIDLPGHGESVSTKELDYSIAHQAKMLDAFLEAKKIKKIHIVGNSMGGAIALQYTGRHKNKVKSLTLINALGMIKSQSELAVMVEETGDNPFFDICTVEAYEKFLHISMQKPPYIPDMLMNVLMKDKCARADIEKVIYKDMIAYSDLGHVANKIKTPTLIIWGQKDRVLHVDNAHLLHSTITGSKLVIYPDLGHVPLLEDPERTANTTEMFVKKYH